MSIRTTRSQDKNAESAVSSVFSIDITDFTLMLEYIQANYKPEEVYDNGELDEWAEKNGYVKEE